MLVDAEGRDSALVNLTDRTATPGHCTRAPTTTTLAARGPRGRHWRRPHVVRGGYLLLRHEQPQNLIVTVTNPPFTPRVVYQAPTF
jgi:hypothetical protein